MNKMKIKDYHKIKNKSVEVITFCEGRRIMSYGNLHYKKAVEYVLRQSAFGNVSIIVDNDTPIRITLIRDQDLLLEKYREWSNAKKEEEKKKFASSLSQEQIGFILKKAYN